MKDEASVKRMNEEEFRKYLKRRGKKPAVADRNVAILEDFISRARGMHAYNRVPLYS